MNYLLSPTTNIIRDISFGGGILGKVVEVGDAFVTLEIADGVRIKVQRGQITSLVPKGTYKSA